MTDAQAFALCMVVVFGGIGAYVVWLAMLARRSGR